MLLLFMSFLVLSVFADVSPLVWVDIFGRLSVLYFISTSDCKEHEQEWPVYNKLLLHTLPLAKSWAPLVRYPFPEDMCGLRLF